MKKRIISLLLAVLLVLSAVPTALAAEVGGFKDVKDTNWYADEVLYVVRKGLFTGTSATTFSPQGKMTRAMFVTVLARMSGVIDSTLEDNGKFNDVKFASWYGPSVIWASNNGIVNGTSATKFSPNANVTRQDIAVMIYRYLSVMNIDVPAASNVIASFKDADKISGYAVEAVDAMRRWGFFGGDTNGNMNPRSHITRAEAATLLMRVNHFIENGEHYDDNANTGGGSSGPAPVEPEPIAVESIAFVQNAISMTKGNSEILSVTINPANASNADITMTSSNAGVVKIENGNKAVAVAVGEATITAKSANGKTATCKVTVTELVVPATGVTVNPAQMSLKVGETQNLTYTVSPADTTEGVTSIVSSDTSVASVKNGVVTAHKAGDAVITVSTASGKSAACTVNVTNVEVESVSLSAATKELKVGSSFTLTATVTPSNAYDKTITWTSSNKSVATVSNTGEVIAVAEGTTTITATSANGKSASCTVTVSPVLPAGVTLSKQSETLAVGATLTIEAYVAPANVSNKTVTWASSDSSVASVDSNGRVTAIKAGETTITATTVNGKTASCEIKVGDIVPTAVTLDKSSVKLIVGETATVTATVTPDNAADKTVTWTSAKESVATVKNGVITAISAGTTTVTAKTSNGVEATVSVTVENKEEENKASFSATKSIVITSNTAYPDMLYDEDRIWDDIRITDSTWGLNDSVITMSGIYPYTFKSSDESIIKVTDCGGLYTPVRLDENSEPKTATITVTNTEDGTTQKVLVTVTAGELYIVDDQYIADVADALLELINEYRAENGLPAYEYMPGDNAQAALNARAEDYADPNGVGFSSFQSVFGYHECDWDAEVEYSDGLASNYIGGKYYILVTPTKAAESLYSSTVDTFPGKLLSTTNTYFGFGHYQGAIDDGAVVLVWGH